MLICVADGCKAERLHSCGDFKRVDPYSNLKNKVENIPESHQKSDKNMLFNINSQYKLNDNLKIRTEEFGGLLYLSNSNFVAIDEVLYDFFTKNEKFCFEDIVSFTKYDREKLLNTLNYLFDKKMVVCENEKKRV